MKYKTTGEKELLSSRGYDRYYIIKFTDKNGTEQYTNLWHGSGPFIRFSINNLKTDNRVNIKYTDKPIFGVANHGEANGWIGKITLAVLASDKIVWEAYKVVWAIVSLVCLIPVIIFAKLVSIKTLKDKKKTYLPGYNTWFYR